MPRPRLVQHFIRANSNAYAPYRWNFDQGSAASIDQTIVRIAPHKTWTGRWAWYAIKNANLRGKTPSFAIAKADHWSLDADFWTACWCNGIDSDAWVTLDNIAIGATDITFNKATPFPPGTIYIAHMPMYPFARVIRKVNTWIAHAYADETASTADNIISYTTPRDNGDGRVAPPLPFYAFKISSTRHAYAKNNMILTAGNHPSEAAGPYQLEGAMAWILGGTPAAEMLLDYFDVYVYPCLNPQGVWGGYFRSCPEDPATDHNRIWDADVLECAHAFRGAMTADTGGVLEVGIDFHSYLSTASGFVYNEDHTEALYAALIAEITAYDAAQTWDDESFITQLHYFWRHTLNANLAIVHETGTAKTQSAVAWQAQGEYTIHAVANMLAKGYFTNTPGNGYRDFNGTTDRIDWAAVWNPTGQAFTFAAWIWLDVKNVNEYFLCIHDAADTSYGLVVNNINPGVLNFIRRGITTDYMWNTTAGPLATGVWQHVIVTSNGGLLTGSVVFYVNGVSSALTFSAGSGGETSHSGSWSLGGRIYSDTRNTNGRICQAAVWDHVLDATEIANLAAGYAPNLAEATGIKFYFKGNTNSLTAVPGGLGVADGTSSVTTIGSAPTIIYL